MLESAHQLETEDEFTDRVDKIACEVDETVVKTGYWNDVVLAPHELVLTYKNEQRKAFQRAMLLVLLQ